jgi:hypothetical protein
MSTPDEPKIMKYWKVVKREIRGEEKEPKLEMIWMVPRYGVLKKYGSAVVRSFSDELLSLTGSLRCR